MTKEANIEKPEMTFSFYFDRTNQFSPIVIDRALSRRDSGADTFRVKIAKNTVTIYVFGIKDRIAVGRTMVDIAVGLYSTSAMNRMLNMASTMAEVLQEIRNKCSNETKTPKPRKKVSRRRKTSEE